MNQEAERGYEEQIVKLTSLLKECIEKNALEIKLQKEGMTIDQAMLMIIKAVSEENQSINEAVQKLKSKIGPKFLENLELAIKQSEFFNNKKHGSLQKEIKLFFESKGVADDLNLSDFENQNNINSLSLVEKYENIFTQQGLEELRQIVQKYCSQKINLSLKNNSQSTEEEYYQKKPPQQTDYSNTYPSEETYKKQITLKETLQEDLKKYPECAEKILVELQVLVLAVIVSQTQLNGDSLLNQIGLIINKFTSQLCESNEFIQDLDYWKLQLCYFSQNKKWKELLDFIKRIFKIIRPINMFELRRLVEKAKEAGKIIKGKDVILFLGATGSGKSTVIHFLAGTPQVQKDDNIFPDMSRIKYPELQQIIVGNEDTSVTRYITPITINLKESGKHQNETLVLCDAPGFFDNQGVEVDIANGIGIVSSLKECRSLKPVIVFSKLGVGDRGDQFKAMIRMLSSLFDGVSDNLSSFYYIFNKYSSGDTLQKIQKKIENIFDAEKEINGELNDTSNEFFEDIIRKCQRKKDVIKLDPLFDDPNKYLKQLNKDSIRNPSEVLQYTISSDSKAHIQSLLGIIQQRLDRYLECQKIDLIMFDMRQLSDLKQILLKKETKQAYDTYIEKVNSRFKNEQIELLNQFNRQIDSQARLDASLLEKYRNGILYYKQVFEKLRKHFNDHDNHNESSFVEELESNFEDKMQYIFEKNIDFLQDHQAATILKIDLENLELIDGIFKQNISYYGKLKSRIQEAFQTLISLIKDNINQTNFQTCGNIFIALKNAINILQTHSPNKEELNVYLTNCSNLFGQFIDRSINKIKVYFNDNQIIFQRIEIEYKVLLSLAEVHELEGCYQNEAKQSIHDQVNTIFREYLIRVKEEFCKSENKRPFDQVKLVLGDIKKMLDLGGNQATLSVYNDFMKEIQSYIRQASQKFDSCLSQMEKNPKLFMQYCRKIEVKLFIKDVKFIEEVLGVSYSSQIDQFEEGLIQFISDLERQINIFFLSNTFYDKSTEIIDFSDKVNCLSGFTEILLDFKKKMLEFEQNVPTIFQNSFQEIKRKYKVGTSTIEDDVFQQKDIAKIENILGFFQSCLHFDIIHKMTLEIQGQFKIHLQTIFDRIQKDTIEILKKIKCNSMLFDSFLLQKYVHLIVAMQKTKNLNELTCGDNKKQQLEQELEIIHQIWKSVEQKDLAIQEYDTILALAKILSDLSIFPQENKFKVIGRSFTSLQNKNTSELEETITCYVKQKLYIYLKDIESREQNKSINAFINKNVAKDVDQMFSECEKTIKESKISNSVIERKIFVEVPENLNHIQNAINSFDTNTNSQSWKIRFQGVQTLLVDLYQIQIKIMNKSVISGQFSQIMEQRRVLQEFETNLKPFENRLDYTCGVKEQNKQLLTVINDWKKQFQQFGNRITLSKYPIGELEKLAEEIPEIKGDFEELIQVVEKQLNLELEKVEDQQDPVQKLNLISSWIATLPEDLKDFWAHKIIQKKNYYSSQQFKDFVRIKDYSIEQNSPQFIELLKKCQDKNLEPIEKNILSKVKCVVAEVAAKIISDLNKKQLSKSISNLISLKRMEKEWGTKLPDINNCFQTSLNTTLSYFKKFITNLTKLDTSQEYLSQLRAFIDVLPDIEGNTCLINPLMQCILDLFECFLTYFGSLKNQFQQAIISLQFQQMQEALNMIEFQNSCLESILKMYDPKNPARSSLKNLRIKSLSFEAACLIIKDSFQMLLQDISNITLVKNTKKERDETFKRFGNRAKFAKDIIKSLKMFENFNPQYQVSIKELNSKLHKAIQECVGIIKQQSSSQGQLDELKFKYENLLSIKEHFAIGNEIFSNNFLEIDIALQSRCTNLLEKGKFPVEISQFSVELIDLKRIQNTITEFSNKIFQKIDQSLAIFMIAQTNKQSAINDLIGWLQLDLTGTWHYVISEHKLFKGYNTELFNEKAKRHGIDYVSQNLEKQAEKNSIDIQKLKEYHNQIQDLHLKIVQQNINKISNPKIANQVIQQIVLDCEKLWKGKKVSLVNNQIKWDNSIRQNIPELIAYLFAVWTLLNAKNDFIEGMEDKFEKLLSPHAGQIVSILRLLGLGYKSSLTFNGKGLVNNLVQIGTGEGKSVALAIVATIFGLLGAKVSCACYSKYLSTRDFESFKSFYETFGVVEKIQFGSFDELCENMINTPVSIRQQVQDFFFKKKGSSEKEIKEPKILLIDEVDMFFSPSFYGQIYQPATRIKHPSINKLVNFLWNNKKNDFVLKRIATSTEFKECCEAFKGWESVLIKVAKAMVVDLKSYNHDYIVKDDQIAYQQEFGISFSMVLGYKTMFSYFQEHESKKISKPRLEDNIYIFLNCGRFSYAQIPLEFDQILGVTGTLNSLIDHQCQILQTKYKIQHFTHIPSVFGENQLKDFSKDIKIENKQDYHLRIKQEIEKYINCADKKRTVLVFFESEKQLEEFNGSSLNTTPYNIITEQTIGSKQTIVEKQVMIKQATMSSCVTLLTRSLGRGTDFICTDKSIINNGGIHVIQTFFSEDRSEEIQIKGRAARQGQQGSFSILLLDSDLEKYLGCEYLKLIQQYREKDELYAKLDESRNNLILNTAVETQISIEKCNVDHSQAYEFREHLNSGNLDKIKMNIESFNTVPEWNFESVSKTLILIDATGSMGSLISAVKNRINEMIKRTWEVLESNKEIQKDSFMMQIAVYRDYDLLDEVLQQSSWESTAKNLYDFLNSITAKGGDDYPEAIEIGLQFANSQTSEEISQIILIGDAPAKSKESITEYRSKKYGGEEYWSKTKFHQQTHYLDEIKALADKNIPIHAFYLHEDAAQNFNEMAKATKGTCQKLKLDFNKESDQLTNLIIEKLLLNIGNQKGKRKGDEMVEKYKKMYAKSYLS